MCQGVGVGGGGKSRGCEGGGGAGYWGTVLVDFNKCDLFCWGGGGGVFFLRACVFCFGFYTYTPEFATFCLHSWCMLGLFLQPVFFSQGHRTSGSVQLREVMFSSHRVGPCYTPSHDRVLLAPAIQSLTGQQQLVGGPMSMATVCLFVRCIMSLQHPNGAQGWISSDIFKHCHTETEVADQTFYLT